MMIIPKGFCLQVKEGMKATIIEVSIRNGALYYQLDNPSAVDLIPWNEPTVVIIDNTEPRIKVISKYKGGETISSEIMVEAAPNPPETNQMTPELKAHNITVLVREIDRLSKLCAQFVLTLEDSNSLILAMEIERRPADEIYDQVKNNRLMINKYKGEKLE